MTEFEAKKIGSRQGLISVGLGILIAQLIMTSASSQNGIVNSFLWFTSFRYNLNILIGIIIMLLSGHYFGQLSGVAILIKKRNYILTGILCGMAILITTAFLSSCTGFFQEGIKQLGTNDDPFEDYILKPAFWIFSIGLLPTFLVGIWFGRQIKKHSNIDKLGINIISESERS